MLLAAASGTPQPGQRELEDPLDTVGKLYKLYRNNL